MNIRKIAIGTGIIVAALVSYGCNSKKQVNNAPQSKTAMTQQPKVDTLEILQKQLTKAKYAMIDSIDAAMAKAKKLPKIR